MATTAFTHGVMLPTTCERAFWDLLEPANVPEYDPDFRSWQPREFPPTVGTRVDFEARFGNRWAKGTSEVTLFEPPNRMELRLVSPRTPVASRLSWDLADSSDGCRFTYRFETDAPPGMGWLGRRLLSMATVGMAEKLERLPERYRPTESD